MPRGRKKQDSQDAVDQYSVTKEELIENLQKEKVIPITADVIAKFDIKPVGKINRFAGKHIQPFAGKTYEESLKMAYEWQARENKANGHVIELVDYYCQMHSGKSILVSFNIRAKETEVDKKEE